MYERFTDRARKVMQLANQEAQRFSHEYIGTEHMLLGLIKEGNGVASHVLKNLDIDLRKVRLEVERIVQPGPRGEAIVLGNLPQTPRAKKAIEYSIEEARNLGHSYVGTEHLLLGLLREEEGVAAQVLMNLGLKLEDVREEVLNLLGHNIQTAADRFRLLGQSKTPALDSFGRDLTEMARQETLNPLIGRQAELRSVFEIFACRDGRTPLLLGEPGVGKATIVAGLAHAIVRDDVPDWLRDHRVIEVNISRLSGEAGDRLAKASRIQALFNEARRAKGVIIYLPSLAPTLRAAGGGLPARLSIGDGSMRCIVSSTPAEYARCLERRPGIGEDFQPVAIKPASVEQTLAVLAGVRERYEAHHKTRVETDALQLIAESADRHLPGVLPGKAVMLLDRCGARAQVEAWRLAPGNSAQAREMDQQIKRINLEKENAVADKDFELAAQLRDEADKLKKSLDRLRQELQPPVPVVNVNLVEEVVRDMAPESQ